MWGKKNEMAKSYARVAYADCPAKSFLNADGQVVKGRNVLEHSLIVGNVARELLRRMPPKIKDKLFPDGSCLVASAHDVGKISPTFYEKIRLACSGDHSGMVELENVNPQLERTWGGHAGCSQVAVSSMGVPAFIPEILGRHHGYKPPIEGRRGGDEVFGGSFWQDERSALISELQIKFEVSWPKIESFAQAQLISGLVTVSDWIGSGELFDNPSLTWEDRIQLAVDYAGFIPPKFCSNLLFADIFDFPAYPLQEEFINQVTGPGVYVLEAPMGVGKTEAALFASYLVLQKSQATGIYFALPSQITSNKILDRFNIFLSKILSDGCNHRSLLLHSKSWLIDTYMGEEGGPGRSWFSASKRGLLAPFAVGTVDQALMACMNVKHGFVRSFGLAGKIVILDEVHSYDSYTGTILEALIEMLSKWNCTVIILSATLSKNQRMKLVRKELSHNDYPLITALAANQGVVEKSIKYSESLKVSIKLISERSLAIDEALERAYGGQQVLWIENTVQESQDLYLDLAARATEINVECGLLHSRFTQADRHKKEELWVSIYGRGEWSRRIGKGRILIGTQVLEQSIDIDADFLISNFAPTDMLLQRLGRLWRHRDAPRPVGSTCEAWIIAPKTDEAICSPIKSFGPTAYVYSPYILCRSLKIWQDQTLIAIPDDLRMLIERTYEPREETGYMAKWLYELEEGGRRTKGRKALSQLAANTLSESGNTLPENKAQTRYSEQESCEVLILKKIRLDSDKKETVVTLINGGNLNLPWKKETLSRHEWRKLSSLLMQQVVSVNITVAPKSVDINILNKMFFHHCLYLGNEHYDEAILRVVIVSEEGELSTLQGGRCSENRKIEYRSDLGYRVIKQ